MNQVTQIIGFSLLFYPLIWELNNDKHGDDGYIKILKFQVKNKTKDVWIRAILIILVSGVNLILNDKCFFCSLVLSVSIHFLFFDYLIAFILGRKNWFEYLGKKSFVDNIDFWASQDPLSRLVIRMAFFTICILKYFNLINH